MHLSLVRSFVSVSFLAMVPVSFFCCCFACLRHAQTSRSSLARSHHPPNRLYPLLSGHPHLSQSWSTRWQLCQCHPPRRRQCRRLFRLRQRRTLPLPQTLLPLGATPLTQTTTPRTARLSRTLQLRARMSTPQAAPLRLKATDQLKRQQRHPLSPIPLQTCTKQWRRRLTQHLLRRLPLLPLLLAHGREVAATWSGGDTIGTDECHTHGPPRRGRLRRQTRRARPTPRCRRARQAHNGTTAVDVAAITAAAVTDPSGHGTAVHVESTTRCPQLRQPTCCTGLMVTVWCLWWRRLCTPTARCSRSRNRSRNRNRSRSRSRNQWLLRKRKRQYQAAHPM